MDIIGQRFGILTAVKKLERTNSYIYYECLCDCGKSKIVRSDVLQKCSKSCGCLQDKIGKRFGKLVVIEETTKDESIKRAHRRWICQCDCGNKKILTTIALYKGKGSTKSCGCAKFGRTREKNKNWAGLGEISKTYWTSILIGANDRKLEFTISMEYAWSLFLKQNRLCALTGQELTFGNKASDLKKNIITASLDRIDSSKGYVEENIQWVHKDVNRMKQHFSQDYFIDTCKKVAIQCS